MPAYSFGLLAPVPLWYLALGRKGRTLRVITAGYTTVWVAGWVLAVSSQGHESFGQLGGFFLLGIGAVCTVHAFVLRSKLSTEQVENSATVLFEGPAVGDLPAWHALKADVASVRSYVGQHAGALPAQCNSLIDEMFSELEQVIAFAADGGTSDAQLRPVQAIVTDYLPTSLRTYLRLPSDYAAHHQNPDGRTAAGELEFQLQLLRDSAKEAAASLYQGDSLRLQEQSTFLEGKFGKSELDLD